MPDKKCLDFGGNRGSTVDLWAVWRFWGAVRRGGYCNGVCGCSRMAFGRGGGEVFVETYGESRLVMGDGGWSVWD